MMMEVVVDKSSDVQDHLKKMFSPVFFFHVDYLALVVIKMESFKTLVF